MKTESFAVSRQVSVFVEFTDILAHQFLLLRLFVAGNEFQRFRLNDGRWLAYSQYGLSEAKPILYFHGWPGSRLEAQLADAVARDFNTRIIAIDRPGMGMSDFQPGRAILDWTTDVEQLANALELERFAVAGISGGEPYALACALKIPTRITVVAIICGAGPPEAFESVTQLPSLHRDILSLPQSTLVYSDAVSSHRLAMATQYQLVLVQNIKISFCRRQTSIESSRG